MSRKLFLQSIGPVARRSVVPKASRSLSSSVSSSRYEELKTQLWERWEESSGQRELDSLKRAVQVKSDQFDSSVDTVKVCRTAVEDAQRSHDESTKLHANLLMRREQWDAADAGAFVECTSKEVQTRHALAKARNALRKAEDDASRQQRDYMDVMRQRYHEEQIWQEKWRMLGTYGTWCLIGLNSLVFFGSQFFHLRREENRLKAIETLITVNLKQMQATVTENAEHAETIASMSKTVKVAASAVEEAASADGEKKADKVMPLDESNEQQMSKEPVDLMKAVKELDYAAVGEYVKNLQIHSKISSISEEVHGPSVAVGAIASASMLLILMVVTSKR